jgi:hypothetical protein
MVKNTESSYDDYYSGSINIGFTLEEDMKDSETKFEITRVS